LRQRHFAVGGERTGQRHAETDFDRFGGLRLGWNGGEQQRSDSSRQRHTAYLKPL